MYNHLFSQPIQYEIKPNQSLLVSLADDVSDFVLLPALSQPLAEIIISELFWQESFDIFDMPLDLQLGKVRLDWGVGYGYRPLDIFTPYRRNPVGIQVEEGAGVGLRPALRADLDPHRPQRLLRGPRRADDPVVEVDPAVDAVLAGGLADVVEDRGAVGDGGAVAPGAERIAEGVHVRVGADTGVAEEVPGAPDRLAGFEQRVALLRRLGPEAVGRTDAGEARADDEDVQMPGGHDCCSDAGISRRPFLPGHCYYSSINSCLTTRVCACSTAPLLAFGTERSGNVRRRSPRCRPGVRTRTAPRAQAGAQP